LCSFIFDDISAGDVEVVVRAARIHHLSGGLHGNRSPLPTRFRSDALLAVPNAAIGGFHPADFHMTTC